MKAQVGSYRCGCSVTATPIYDAPRDPAYVFPDSRIEWCPLHAAAEEMRAALQETLRALEAHLDDDTRHANLKHRDLLCPCNENEVKRARALLAKVQA